MFYGLLTYFGAYISNNMDLEQNVLIMQYFNLYFKSWSKRIGVNFQKNLSPLKIEFS